MRERWQHRDHLGRFLSNKERARRASAILNLRSVAHLSNEQIMRLESIVSKYKGDTGE